MKKKILVYGAGVIGSIYALRFSRAGYDVSVLTRGDRLSAIRDGGLRVRQVFLEEEESAEVRVLDKIDPDTWYDLVLVVVRSGQVTGILKDLSGMPKPGAVVVIGNNLGDFEEQEALAGDDRFILGFGAFGGYREKGTIVYLDGRTKEKPWPEARSKTTLGILSPESSQVLEEVLRVFESAGLPCSVCEDMRSWLLCHAALVFPLAGGMYAAGGEQERVSRTRDAAVLGVRACRELLKALRARGYRVLPKSLKSLMVMPEGFLVRMVMKSLKGEGARVAMFGHANAPGGRNEIGGQALVLDMITRSSGREFPSWDRLLPYFGENPPEFLKDGSREIPLRLW